MDWLTILILLLAGLGLIVLEVIFIPGGITGLIGAVLMIAGVVISFQKYGSATGYYVLAGSAAISIAVIVYCFKTGLWHKFALKSSIKSKVNNEHENFLKVDEEGITVSALRPVGKAEFRDKIFEVSTIGTYLDEGSKIKIIKIEFNKIFVEPLT